MPTDPHAPPHPPPAHGALVTAGPDDTFGVECAALDWFSQETFATEQEARESTAMQAHLTQV